MFQKWGNKNNNSKIWLKNFNQITHTHIVKLVYIHKVLLENTQQVWVGMKKILWKVNKIKELNFQYWEKAWGSCNFWQKDIIWSCKITCIIKKIHEIITIWSIFC